MWQTQQGQMGTLGKKQTDQTTLALVSVTLIYIFIYLMWHHHNKQMQKQLTLRNNKSDVIDEMETKVQCIESIKQKFQLLKIIKMAAFI